VDQVCFQGVSGPYWSLCAGAPALTADSSAMNVSWEADGMTRLMVRTRDMVCMQHSTAVMICCHCTGAAAHAS